MAPTCELCGRRPEGDEVPLTWSTSLERGRLRHLCEQCSRDNLRAIEGRLDPEWW